MKPQQNPSKLTDKLSDNKRLLLEKRLNRKAFKTNKANAAFPLRPQGSKPIAAIGQKRIWLLDEIAGNTPSFNLTSSFYIKSVIDDSALEAALNKVVERHEVLRSRYVFEDSELIQITQDKLKLTVERITCKADESLKKRAQDFVRIPFQIDQLPLVRMGLISESKTSHILCLSIHHIIFDEWSLNIFWKEFSAYYNENTTGKTASFPALPIQYSDFAHWQREWLRNSEANSQLAYWKNKLNNPPPPIPLFTNRPYPNIISDQGALERSTIHTATVKELKKLAAENNASLFMLLILAYSILLGRYSNTTDLLVSSPVANRRKRETSDLIGFFLNTIVIRTDLSGDPTVLEAIEETKKTSVDAFNNQDISPDAIVEELRPERIPGRHPLFQTMFVYQKEEEGKPRLELHDCNISPTLVDTKTSKFDICLFVTENPEGMDTIAEYRTDIFDSSTIQRFLGHFSELVSDLSNNPQKKISELNILSSSEIEDLLNRYQGKSEKVDSPEPLPYRLSKIAIANSNKTALIFNGESLSYSDLEKRTLRLAKKLSAMGAGANLPIGIFMNRSTNAIISVLAVLRSGSPYLPLDPTYPIERSKSIILDANPIAIITDSKHSKSLSKLTSTQQIDVNNYDTIDATLPEIGPGDLAYIIFTSGSTGKAKGVKITHDNLLCSTLSRKSYYPENSPIFLLLSNLSFDSSVAGIFWTLLQAGTLVVPNQGDERDPHIVRQLIFKHRVNTILCVPSLHSEFLKSESHKLQSLKTAIVAGEECSAKTAKEHFEQLPACSLYNEYGPTEATVWCTASKLENRTPITIGKSIPNYQVHVLDEKLHLLPIGLPGELYIAGPGVSSGYLNDDRLTSDKFPHVRLPKSGAIRMYQTGDRARRLENGKLEFLGRNDKQVKIRGNRIELGDIEEAINKHPCITESATIYTQEDPSDSSSARLVAFMRVSKKELFSNKDLSNHLTTLLPSYAIPSQFIVLENFPQLPNGKVDRNALPIPSRETLPPRSITLPTSQTETKLVDIWKRILSIREVSTSDNFFDLGGTSLLAIRLVSSIKDSFDTKLSAGLLLQAPTVVELAKLIDEDSNLNQNLNLVRFKRGSSRTPIFFVPSGGLEIIFYRSLAAAIDDSIPVYGIQPVGFREGETPLRSVEAMASHYVKEIKSVLPRGPFFLAGHCFGATIALEMAKQLSASKIEVALVISLDGQAPRPYGYLDPKKDSFFKNANDPKRMLSDINESIRAPLRAMKEGYLIRNGSDDQKTKYLIKKTGRIVRDAFVAYRSENFTSKVLAFNCTESKESARHTATAWKESCRNVEMVTIDCGHQEILEEPHVFEIARRINDSLL